MTAITLNLLGEEQRAQEARARDPLKTCIAIGVSLVMVTAVTGSICSVVAGNRKAQEDALKSQYDQIVARREAGVATGFSALKGYTERVISINKDRVMFAPQMALLKDVVPETIELTRLELSIATELEQGSGGSDGQPSSSRNVERLNMRMEGRATCARPELAVDTFINSMGAHDQLKSMIDKVQLRSIAKVPLRDFETSTKGSAVSFVIEAAYKQP